MSSYVGGILIGVESYPIGSTLYGICNTDANALNKKVVLSQFDQLLDGITVHVKFIKGNTVSSGTTLQFYPTDGENVSPNMEDVAAIPITGAFICETNSIISFTLDNLNGTKYWRVNDAVKVEEGTTNGTIKVNGEEISIHGLGTAAYTDSSTYATSTHNHDSVYAPKNNPVFTGTVTLPGAPSTSNEAATKQYVDTKTQGLDNLSSAMIFKGVLDSTEGNVVTNGGNESPYINNTQLTNKTAGDVVLYGQQEFVWNGNNWQLFGDEGSYALKTSTGTATKINDFTTNTLPTLTVTPTDTSLVTVTEGSNAVATTQFNVPNVTQAGSPMRAQVSQGVLTLTPGTATTLGNSFTIDGVDTNNIQKIPNVSVTNVQVGSASGWNAGGQASLSRQDLTVVVPNNS